MAVYSFRGHDADPTDEGNREGARGIEAVIGRKRGKVLYMVRRRQMVSIYDARQSLLPCLRNRI